MVTQVSHESTIAATRLWVVQSEAKDIVEEHDGSTFLRLTRRTGEVGIEAAETDHRPLGRAVEPELAQTTTGIGKRCGSEETESEGYPDTMAD